MQKDYYFLPKDSFLEDVLDLAKERHLMNYTKAKSELVVKETLAGTVDGYVMDTVGSIEGKMQEIKGMDYQDFLLYLLYKNKGSFTSSESVQPTISNLIESILPPIDVFVDRGYERHTV